MLFASCSCNCLSSQVCAAKPLAIQSQAGTKPNHELCSGCCRSMPKNGSMRFGSWQRQRIGGPSWPPWPMPAQMTEAALRLRPMPPGWRACSIRSNSGGGGRHRRSSRRRSESILQLCRLCTIRVTLRHSNTGPVRSRCCTLFWHRASGSCWILTGEAAAREATATMIATQAQVEQVRWSWASRQPGKRWLDSRYRCRL